MISNNEQEKFTKYRAAIQDAITYMEFEHELEPTSALKQAGSDHGIKDGKQMLDFMTFANKVLFKN
jgi:hypothetical protein